MEMPPPLRRAVDEALSGTAMKDIAAAAGALSERYRAGQRGREYYVASDRDALAYLATRLPATYAAVRASLAAIAEARPDFAPASMLDVGAGPGTALWAAADCWPTLNDAMLVEASPVIRTCGEMLARHSQLPRITWCAFDITARRPDCAPRDLVTMAYVLNELTADSRPSVLQHLWQLTADTLLIVEPGTPEGWERILAARRQLIADGAHIIAPCPHAHECPVQAPDWCHFAQRVARSRLHRLAKGAEVPWEDEKFSYVAVSRKASVAAGERVIAPPRKGSGHVRLKLCRTDGSLRDELVSRRQGGLFKRASRCHWGDSF
ncbi:MAG TPA: small ribosomal subunit Rsm22 family protein [Pseudolabrys sp.]|nr:small ribosomal subunit Rsm22 family protein [Pseudolabrys sp.]